MKKILRAVSDWGKTGKDMDSTCACSSSRGGGGGGEGGEVVFFSQRNKRGTVIVQALLFGVLQFQFSNIVAFFVFHYTDFQGLENELSNSYFKPKDWQTLVDHNANASLPSLKQTNINLSQVCSIHDTSAT